jgi:2-polyprenyl-3-methyl-5-hydroxy-6-metoxy-1,4-benzoquinol methylase
MTADSCPVCGAPTVQLRHLKADFLRSAHEKHYGVEITSDLGFRDYDVIRCQKCALEFAWPMEQGGEAFYEWITRQRSYYPVQRWEWPLVAGLIKQYAADTGRAVRVLEIGCGAGDFLRMFGPGDRVHATGLDLTPSVVARCRADGLDVHCENLASYLARESERFDFAVAFHCLEHVPNPKAFATSVAAALNPGGRIFFSTPYSPMSFERGWYDPLNHPPHHVTRWRARAYQALANSLGMNVHLRFPRASSASVRTAYALNLAWFGPHHMASPRRLAFAMATQPLRTAAEFLHQISREKIDGRTAADVVLAELTSA